MSTSAFTYPPHGQSCLKSIEIVQIVQYTHADYPCSLTNSKWRFGMPNREPQKTDSLNLLRITIQKYLSCLRRKYGRSVRIMLGLTTLAVSVYFIWTMHELFPRLSAASFIFCSIIITMEGGWIPNKYIRGFIYKIIRWLPSRLLVTMIGVYSVFASFYCLSVSVPLGISLLICIMVAYERYPAPLHFSSFIPNRAQ